MSSRRNINIFLISLIFIFAIILGWSFANLFNNKDSNQYIDNSFNLINHNGEEVSIKSYSNQNKVFFFGFTHCPDVCPMGVSILSNVIDEIEEKLEIDDYKFTFVSVDPDRDTPNRLNKFLSNFNEKIVGLTGDYESLKPVWENFFVHVKSDLSEQGSSSELDKTKKEKSHDDHDSHSSHGDHGAGNNEEDLTNNYIVQHSAFYFIFDRKDNLKTILPFGSSSEEILAELSNL
ncbi:MAG: SCO family protein [Pelagibacterales bacterium]|nr:SCO family protein [Pelagibacterales bacterium]